MHKLVFEGDRALAFAAFSFSIGVFWALLFTVLLENNLFAFASSCQGACSPFRVGSLLTGALVAGAAPAACRKHPVHLSRGVVRKVARGSFFAAVLLDVACTLASFEGLWLQGIVWVLLGVTLACLFLSLVGVSAGFARRERIVMVASSTAVGAVLYFAMNALGPIEGLLVFAPCVFAGAWIARFGDEGAREEGRRSETDGDSFVMPKIFYASVAIYSSVFGLMFAQVVQIREPFWVGLTALALGAPALVLWFAALRLPQVQHWIASGVLQRSIAALVVAGVLPLALLGESVAAPCCLVIVAAFSLYCIADLASRFIVAADGCATPLPFVAKRQAFLFLGLGVGYAFGIALPFVGDVGSARPIAIAALAFTVLLVIIVAATPYPSSRDQSVPQAAEKGIERPRRWSVACDAVASRYGLTKRESEVFGLLSKGRSTRYIQEKFVISPHTVETHIHNIYTKMGIGSRDELVKLVEDEMGADDGGGRD